ncbi:hypothetical protein F5Y13DRAFT_121114 [Hypoxylon sp. FL1857]|nr:hypothetical protein F5Y13DRAFT_121114 [Hypoxylon sp. FL1857]
MTFRVFDDGVLGALFVSIIVCTPIAILVTVLRFVATRKSQRKIGLEDYLALLALLFNLGFNALELYTLTLMNGVNSLGLAKLPYNTIRQVLKVGYFVNFMFPMNQTFAKLSLLVLYHRIFSSSTTFTRWVWGVAFVQISWGIAMFFTRVFGCTPIYKFWEIRTPGTCISAKALLAAPEVINSTVDFVMVGMAVWIIHKLQISTRDKWRLSGLFTLGSLAGVIGIVKICDSYSTVGESGLDAVWDVFQMCASVICCCLPIYKVLLPNTGFFRALRSRLSESSIWKLSSRKPSSSGISKATSREENGSMQHWLSLNESSTPELAWKVETASFGRKSSSGGPESQRGYRPYPTQGVRIQQTVEVV